MENMLARRDVLRLGAALALGAFTPKGLRAGTEDDRFDWTLREPEEAGMSRAGLEGIRAAIQMNIDDKVIPGAVTAVARNNKLVWFEAQGARDPESGSSMAKDDIFRMASSSKPVTAVATLMMMDEGKLSLDDKVGRFIPEFKDTKVAVAKPGAKDAKGVELVPADRDVTIKDLLTHTSGLMSFGDFLVPAPGSLVNKVEVKPGDTLADVIPRLGAAALDYQPGTKWRYSPLFGIDVLLRIVEVVSGQTADRFLQERLFEPLKMRDTYFNVPAEKEARVVNIYGRQSGKWKVEKHILGEGPYTYLSGAGGLFSTAHDYLQFEAMLFNRGSLNGRRLLKPETVALMAKNHVGKLFAEWIPPITAGQGFGLGVRVVEDPAKGGGLGVGSFGWGGAYGTESWVDPELGVAAALFIQVTPGPANLKTDFQQAIRKAIVE